MATTTNLSKFTPKNVRMNVVEMNSLSFEDMIEGFLESRRNGQHGANHPTRSEASLKAYRNNLDHIITFLKAQRARTDWRQVTEQDIAKFIAYMNQRDISVATRYQHFRTLKAFLHWIKKDPMCKTRNLQHFLADDVLPKIPRNPAKIWVPSMTQVAALMKAFDQELAYEFRDYVVCNILLDCGARIGEICNLTIHDVKWSTNQIELNGKSKTSRMVPLTIATMKLIRKWLKVREGFVKEGSNNEWLFVSRFGDKCNNMMFAKAWTRYRIRAGIDEDLTPHTLRHYFATAYLIKTKGDISGLKAILGHTSYEMLQVYVNEVEISKTLTERHEVMSPMTDLRERVKDGDRIIKKRRTGTIR